MNDEQYKRFRKMQTETLETLIYKRNAETGDINFLVNGSSGEHYKVKITRNGRISCSCPDFTCTCVVQECVCKHCLHVILQTLKLFKNPIDHTFFTRCRFTPDEMQSIHTVLKHTRQKVCKPFCH